MFEAARTRSSVNRRGRAGSPVTGPAAGRPRAGVRTARPVRGFAVGSWGPAGQGGGGARPAASGAAFACARRSCARCQSAAASTASTNAVSRVRTTSAPPPRPARGAYSNARAAACHPARARPSKLRTPGCAGASRPSWPLRVGRVRQPVSVAEGHLQFLQPVEVLVRGPRAAGALMSGTAARAAHARRARSAVSASAAVVLAAYTEQPSFSRNSPASDSGLLRVGLQSRPLPDRGRIGSSKGGGSGLRRGGRGVRVQVQGGGGLGPAGAAYGFAVAAGREQRGLRTGDRQTGRHRDGGQCPFEVSVVASPRAHSPGPSAVSRRTAL